MRGAMPLDHEGAFVLDGLRAGEVQLVLRAGPGGAVMRAYVERLRIASGDNDWSRDLAVGALVLGGLPRAEPAGDDHEVDWPEYALAWTDGAGSGSCGPAKRGPAPCGTRRAARSRAAPAGAESLRARPRRRAAPASA
jgi:hypothetical protein